MLQSKCAVITGAAQGIGRRTAEKFAGAGYRLALIDLCARLRRQSSLCALLERNTSLTWVTSPTNLQSRNLRKRCETGTALPMSS